MIEKPWKIGFKASVCLFFLFITILYLIFSVKEINEELKYASPEAELGRMETLCASGDYGRIRETLRYSENNYMEEFDAMWKIADAYDVLCAYELYCNAAIKAESDAAEYYKTRAREMKAQLESNCKDATYPQNQKAYNYFIRRAGFHEE